MQIRILDKAIASIIRRRVKETKRSLTKEVEFLLSQALTVINKKL